MEKRSELESGKVGKQVVELLGKVLELLGQVLELELELWALEQTA